MAAETSAAYQRAGGATSAPRTTVSHFSAEPFEIDGTLVGCKNETVLALELGWC